MNMNKQSARGFSLIETGAMLAIVSLIGMVVGPVVVESRSQMRRATSTANLQQIGQSAAVYGFSNNGRLFSYSWRAGETYLMPDGRPRTSNDDQGASASQNEEILERMTGRLNGRTKIQGFQARLPQRRFNHLILIDFLGEELGSSKYIDPADAKQLYWAANPLEYLLDDREDITLPYGNHDLDFSDYDNDPNWKDNPILQRWTFASSYQFVPASWQPDYPQPQYVPVENTPHLFRVMGETSNVRLDLHTGRNFFELQYPSQKVWLHEEFDRGTLRPVLLPNKFERRVQHQSFYFAYDFAQPEKLMFDLSVNSWASGDANSSRIEHEGGAVWTQSYVPLHQFPLPIGGLGDDTELDMRYRWTHEGLRGADYGAKEP